MDEPEQEEVDIPEERGEPEEEEPEEAEPAEDKEEVGSDEEEEVVEPPTNQPTDSSSDEEQGMILLSWPLLVGHCQYTSHSPRGRYDSRQHHHHQQQHHSRLCSSFQWDNSNFQCHCCQEAQGQCCQGEPDHRGDCVRPALSNT